MIPFLWIYFGNNAALDPPIQLGHMGELKQAMVNWQDQFTRHISNVSLKFLFDKGDPFLRHHIPGGGDCSRLHSLLRWSVS